VARQMVRFAPFTSAALMYYCNSSCSFSSTTSRPDSGSGISHSAPFSNSPRSLLGGRGTMDFGGSAGARRAARNDWPSIHRRGPRAALRRFVIDAAGRLAHQPPLALSVSILRPRSGIGGERGPFRRAGFSAARLFAYESFSARNPAGICPFVILDTALFRPCARASSSLSGAKLWDSS
jgi:hypothetical protein